MDISSRAPAAIKDLSNVLETHSKNLYTKELLRVTKRIYKEIIKPVAGGMKRETFVDVSRYIPEYNEATDKAIRAGKSIREIRNMYPSWSGGSMPEYVVPIDKFLNDYRESFYYPVHFVIGPGKVNGKTGNKPINILLNYDELSIMEPLSSFYGTRPSIDFRKGVKSPGLIGNPKKFLKDEISYFEFVYGEFMKAFNHSFRFACVYYRELLGGLGFEKVSELKRVGKHYEIKVDDREIFKLHNKGDHVKIDRDFDESIFAGMSPNISVFKEGKLLAEGGKLVKQGEKVTAKQYFKKNPKFFG